MNRKIAFEHVLQRYDYDCGVAAVSTFMSITRNTRVDLDDLQRQLKALPASGTSPDNITNYLLKEKVPFVEKVGSKMWELEELITKGYVCLVVYQAWYSEEEKNRLECGHYSIVIDIDSEFVWLVDPGVKEETEPGTGVGVVKRSRTEYDKWWIDKDAAGKVYDHWMVGVRVGNSGKIDG